MAKKQRVATEVDYYLAKDRLRGTGAWNGQGLLVHLALTARKDSSREWMEPLRDLCESIVASYEDNEELVLTPDQADVLDDLKAYSDTFHAALTE